jgi:hypothetical protein
MESILTVQVFLLKGSEKMNRLCIAAKKAMGFALVLTAMAPMAHAVAVATPEIDAGSMASALTLLAGGAMLLKDKFFAK